MLDEWPYDVTWTGASRRLEKMMSTGCIPTCERAAQAHHSIHRRGAHHTTHAKSNVCERNGGRESGARTVTYLGIKPLMRSFCR